MANVAELGLPEITFAYCNGGNRKGLIHCLLRVQVRVIDGSMACYRVLAGIFGFWSCAQTEAFEPGII